MSKNIKITEGEKIRTFTNVSKIYTRLSDGTMQSWIPLDVVEDEGHYLAITIEKPGTFIAPFDGFSSVTVAIPETTEVSGIEDGIEVVYTVDENGNLARTEVE